MSPLETSRAARTHVAGDDGDEADSLDLGGDGGEPAGSEHVAGGEEAREEVGGGGLGRGDQDAVGERNPRDLGLFQWCS